VQRPVLVLLKGKEQQVHFVATRETRDLLYAWRTFALILFTSSPISNILIACPMFTTEPILLSTALGFSSISCILLAKSTKSLSSYHTSESNLPLPETTSNTERPNSNTSAFCSWLLQTAVTLWKRARSQSQPFVKTSIRLKSYTTMVSRWSCHHPLIILSCTRS